MWGHCPLQQLLLPSLLVGMHLLETCVFVVDAAAAGFAIVVAQEVVLALSFVVVFVIEFGLVVFVGHVVVASDVVATAVAVVVPVFETVVVVVVAAAADPSMQEGLEKSDQNRGLQY